MIIEGIQPVRLRVPQTINRQVKCLNYDLDNLYPQRAIEVLAASYTLVSIIEKKSGFLNGEGFEDQSFADLVVYQNGLKKVTGNILLNKIAAQMCVFKGVALHIGYNLNYTVDSVKPINFDYCRFGIPSKDEIDIIAYSTNWEKLWQKEERTQVIDYYHRFNPDPEIVAEQIEACGGIENYKGQIYYWTPEDNQYPKASFDAVFDHAQAQSEIGSYILNNIVNGFTAGSIFAYPGKFETEEERKAFKDRMQDHKGSQGANSMLIIEAGVADIDVTKLITKTDLQNNDKVFDSTSNYIEKAMLQLYGMPYPILGKMPDSGMFNTQEIEDSYTFYNAVTRDERNIITDIFEEIFAFWKDELSGNFNILPQKYQENGASSVSIPASTFQPDPKQQAVDTIIRSLSRRDISKIYSFVNDYKKGRSTLEQTIAFLKPFLQTDENVSLFLNDIEDDG